MNFVIEILGAILSRIAGWLMLSLAVGVLRLVGKGLGAAAQPLLTLLRVRRLESSPVAAGSADSAAPAESASAAATVTCPHCGAATPAAPFCAVCGRALPAA